MDATKTQKAIFVIGVLFFIFGFVTWLNATLIPYLTLVCELKSSVQAFFVTFAFYISYLVLSVPASLVLKKTGLKNGMPWGLAVMGVGALVFIPAAYQRSYPLFLLGLFVQGGGLSLLQTASNPYISILGPIESAAKRISIMGICNKLAGTLSPFILSAVLLKGTDSIRAQVAATSDSHIKEQLLGELAGRVVLPYTLIGVSLFILAFLIFRSSLPEIEVESVEGSAVQTADKKSIFGYPYLLLGVICIFFYTGVEVLAGDGIGVYGQSEGMKLAVTKNFSSFTLGAMLIGYIVGVICIPKRFSQLTGLRVSAVLGVVFSTLSLLTGGYWAIFFIALMGLANALMWPAIWPLAIDGLGRHIKTGAAMLVMGICGAAVIPPIYGALKDLHVPNKAAFFYCAFPCYLYILYFAFAGYKRGRK